MGPSLSTACTICAPPCCNWLCQSALAQRCAALSHFVPAQAIGNVAKHEYWAGSRCKSALDDTTCAACSLPFMHGLFAFEQQPSCLADCLPAASPHRLNPLWVMRLQRGLCAFAPSRLFVYQLSTWGALPCNGAGSTSMSRLRLSGPLVWCGAMPSAATW